LVDLAVDGRIILKWTLREYDVKAWARFISIRIETSSGLL